MSLLTVVVVVALAGAFIGWNVEHAAYLLDRRDRWQRTRDLYRYTLDGRIDDLEPVYGLVAYDTAVIPEDLLGGEPTAKVMRRWGRGWLFNYLRTCAVCTGVHGCWVVLAVWAASAWAGGGTLIGWADAVPVWLAASMLHTTVTLIGDRLNVWECDDV